MIRSVAGRLFVHNLFVLNTCMRQFPMHTPKISLIFQSTKAVCLRSFAAKSNGYPKQFSEEELRNRLTPHQYDVTQHAGTERAFTGKYWDSHHKGIYKCVVCKEDLFTSETKFESGSGWPSFYDVINKGNVELVRDNSYGMVRTEVQCSSCGAHLGHLFDDGPKPTGLRYCMNSASLDLTENED